VIIRRRKDEFRIYHVGDMINEYKILVPKGTKFWNWVGIDQMILLKWISENEDVNVWIRLIQIGIGF
jgi:hypothetical protein